MKTKISFLLTIFVLFLFLPLNSRAEKVYNIGHVIFPPYMIEEKGKSSGFCTEIVKALFKELNLKYKITIYPMKRLMIEIDEGRVDVAYPFWKWYLDQAKFYPTEEPILQTRWTFTIRKKDAEKFSFDINDLYTDKGIKGKRVGWVRGYVLGDVKGRDLHQFLVENSSVRDVTTDELNMIKLINNRVDYIVGEYGVSLYNSKKNGALDQISSALPEPYATLQHFLCFKDIKDAELFSGPLKRFKASRQYKELCIKYFGSILP